MDVFVAIGELVTERFGTALNFFRPPSTNMIDGIKASAGVWPTEKAVVKS